MLGDNINNYKRIVKRRRGRPVNTVIGILWHKFRNLKTTTKKSSIDYTLISKCLWVLNISGAKSHNQILKYVESLPTK
jgi:hypothetical protein